MTFPQCTLTVGRPAAPAPLAYTAPMCDTTCWGVFQSCPTFLNVCLCPPMGRGMLSGRLTPRCHVNRRVCPPTPPPPPPPPPPHPTHPRQFNCPVPNTSAFALEYRVCSSAPAAAVGRPGLAAILGAALALVVALLA